MTAMTKRANFDLSPEQEELLAHLRAQLSASSTKDAVLRAVQLTAFLSARVFLPPSDSRSRNSRPAHWGLGVGYWSARIRGGGSSGSRDASSWHRLYGWTH
jgi:hypothetical protein